MKLNTSKLWKKTKNMIITGFTLGTITTNTLISQNPVNFQGNITNTQGTPIDQAKITIEYKGANGWNTIDSTTTNKQGNYNTTILGTENQDKPRIPETTQLIKQNNPNPFNPSTTTPINPETDKIIINNNLGQIIATINGPDKNHWNTYEITKNLPTGIYYITAINEETRQKQTIKTILIDGGKTTFKFKTDLETITKKEFNKINNSKDSIRYTITKKINNEYDIKIDTTIAYNGENPFTQDFTLPTKTITIKYQDAGTKTPITGDSLIIKELNTNKTIAKTTTKEQGTTNIEIPTNTTITLRFYSPDSTYLIYNDTINTNNTPDTLTEEGIKNLPINTNYWQGFKDYAWHITGAKFDPEGRRRFSHWELDSIPIHIPEKIAAEIDWKQRFIDSVITPLNNLVISPEKPWNALYVTNDSLLAENQGIRIIYDSNNRTVTYHLDPNNIWILSNAKIYWKIRAPPDDERSDFEGKHELYLHAFFDGLHSPDPQDLFHGPPARNFQPYEKYLLQIVWNKRTKNLKGYEDYNKQ